MVGTPPAFDTPTRTLDTRGTETSFLLTKAGCSARTGRIRRHRDWTARGNPFPDATPEFFTAMARARSLGLAHEIEIVAPFAAWHKEDVVRRGLELRCALELTSLLHD